MHLYRLIKKFLMALPLIFLAILVAACGSNSGSTTTTAATSTSTSSASACVSVASGLVQSIANNTLLVATRQGKEMQVVYTSVTVFMKQVAGKQSDLQEGMRVTAAITQNPDNSYTATLISLRSGALGRSGSGSGGTATPSRTCSSNGRGFQGGTPGTQGSQRTGSRTRHSLSGTIAQLNGNTLVITDRTGNDISVTLNAATRIINTTSASASDVKLGDTISAIGITDSSGILHAVQVLIQSDQSATPAPTTTNQ